jgi:UDP-glucose 4-epimerase
MKYFKNKKVLITGGAGFIGSHLVKRLVNVKAKVSVVVKYNSIINCPRLLGVWDKIKIIESDLRNLDSVDSLKKLKFDYIFHFAAYNHVGDSFRHVTENINSNLFSTINLLDHGPQFEKFIHIGSSEIYGLQKKVPFNVNEVPVPMSPYALAKYSSELYARLKSRQSRNNLICIRPFNTFGPYQSEKAIIPEMIIKCLLGKEIKTTSGEQTREFNYIDNIIDGILLLCKKVKHMDKPINLGSNNPIKIKDLVKKIHKFTKSESVLKIGAIKHRPNEIWKMQAENKFVTKNIGWKPAISFDQGLLNCVDWYKRFVKLYYDEKSFFKHLL